MELLSCPTTALGCDRKLSGTIITSDKSHLLTYMISAFRRAASHKEKLAEVYETEIGDPKKAIESYELAASWYVCTCALLNGEVVFENSY